MSKLVHGLGDKDPELRWQVGPTRSGVDKWWIPHNDPNNAQDFSESKWQIWRLWEGRSVAEVEL